MRKITKTVKLSPEIIERIKKLRSFEECPTIESVIEHLLEEHETR